MSDHRKTVGEWLSHKIVWRIPVYQRHYAWDAEMESGPIHLFWETVEEQVVARLDGKVPPQHYLGAVLVDNKTAIDAEDGIIRYDVVDGQQRLTTIQIALLELVNAAADHRCGDEIKTEAKKYVFAGESARDIRLNPTNFDRKQFQKVLFDVFDIIPDVGESNVSRENAKKSKIVSTFGFFEQRYAHLVEKRTGGEPRDVLRAVLSALIEGFDIVRIVLRPSDEAQRVFESLNNYAKPLTTFDLIRNDVFYRASKERIGLDQKLFESDIWQQLENPYWEEKADNRKTEWSTHIEAYVARMLVANTGRIFRRNEIVKTYKNFRQGENFATIEDEINCLVRYTDVYRCLDANPGLNSELPDIDFGVFRHTVWKNRDFYPVLFLIADGNANAAEKRRMILLMESYVVRRSVCGLPSDGYNKSAVAFCKELRNNLSYDSLFRKLKDEKADTTLFPGDEKVMRDCIYAPFYKSPFGRYVFEQIELSLHDVRAERVVVAEGILTIDHILPQKWEQSDEWKKIVLENDAHSDIAPMKVNPYIHTIGNLTLMSGRNNSIKSNRPLADVKGLLSETTVKLNRELAEVKAWNEEEIQARSRKLADLICKIWPYDIA